jgi:hypothetical protein
MELLRFCGGVKIEDKIQIEDDNDGPAKDRQSRLRSI